MNKKLKILNTVFISLLSVTLFPTVVSVIYLFFVIDTGDGWETFGYGILGVLILLAGITLALTECEIYSSIRYFVFSDKKRIFASILHLSAIIFLLIWIVCTFVTDELALTLTISYTAVKLIHLIYFLIRKLTKNQP